MISLYDWYNDAKGRTWVVVRIWTTGIYTTIDLLEVGAVGPINQPEIILLDLIKSGSFKKIKRS